MDDDRKRWDRRYHEEPRLASLEPAAFLVAHARELPPRGRALDVACGAGRNAIFLAERGLETVGMDVSPVGLELARGAAARRGVALELVAADLASPERELPRNAFDVVACIHYLERSIFTALEDALRPGGLLVFETFTRDQLAFPEAHPRREEFLLAPNELLHAFPRLHVVLYSEGAGCLADGHRTVTSRLLARKRT
jgi:SAM-dependent methyltransferase